MQRAHVLRIVLLLSVSYSLFPGCNGDETTEPPAGFGVSSSTVTTSSGSTSTTTISGGTTPYSLQTLPDSTIATVSISGSNLSVTGVAGGYSSFLVADASGDTIRVGAAVTGPITYTLFPLTLLTRYVYDGYAISTTVDGSVTLPDPADVYQATWLLVTSPIPGTTMIVDSTTLQLPVGVVTASRALIIKQDVGTGAFDFLQTLGPFFRAFSILPLGRTDTTRWIRVADPSVGIGGSWTAFDSTYTNVASNAIRLQIVGALEAGETISDSASTPGLHDAVRFRTHRNIFVEDQPVVSNATTSRLWLEKNGGPVQVHIAEDTENLGHFRTMKEKNY